ncbi:MAG TPA: alpha/beta hydrolase [Candidatus Limosilactobacillus excrementigallinarum]|nr:alpha/beta hydrolase [Candidatus Limosilactobacillus excrementigallinarum]
MSKSARYSIATIIIIIILGIVGGAWYQHKKSSKFVQSTTPTLFFHGGGSSYHAEEHMVNAAKKAGVTKTVLRANVAKDGYVTLHGTMHKNSINPIVEVNYEDNRQLDFNKHGVWATNVVKALQKQYGIKNINMVGHSLGNISIIYYLLQNAQNKSMPKLRKQVDMAGHFDGLDFAQLPAEIRQPQNLKLGRNGKPNHMNATYRQMTKLRSIYPKNQIRVLNIIGNIGGKTDGTVTNVSSLSLKYLVAQRAKSYQVKTFHGKLARHSKLHSNPAVDKVLIQFLWGK